MPDHDRASQTTRDAEAQIASAIGQGTADERAEDEAACSVAEPPVTFSNLFGSIPPLPGRETVDFKDLIREAMDDRADEIVRRLEDQ